MAVSANSEAVPSSQVAARRGKGLCLGQRLQEQPCQSPEPPVARPWVLVIPTAALPRGLRCRAGALEDYRTPTGGAPHRYQGFARISSVLQAKSRAIFRDGDRTVVVGRGYPAPGC